MWVFLAALAVMAAPGVGWTDAQGLELPTRDAALDRPGRCLRARPSP